MAKCFITGIDVVLDEAHVLDLGAAHRALRDLRQRVSVLERLIAQLGGRDAVEVFDPRSRETRTRSDRRLVSPTVARALAAAHPETPLFLPWPEYRKRGARLVRELRSGTEEAVGASGQVAREPEDPAVVEPPELQEGEPDDRPA